MAAISKYLMMKLVVSIFRTVNILHEYEGIALEPFQVADNFATGSFPAVRDGIFPSASDFPHP